MRASEVEEKTGAVGVLVSELDKRALAWKKTMQMGRVVSKTARGLAVVGVA